MVHSRHRPPSCIISFLLHHTWSKIVLPVASPDTRSLVATCGGQGLPGEQQVLWRRYRQQQHGLHGREGWELSLLPPRSGSGQRGALH